MFRGLQFDNATGITGVEVAPGIWRISASLPSVATPGPHAASHKAGGTDSIKLDELAAPTDITTLNVSTTAHGLTPKLPNDATKFLDGTGAYSIPAGGSDMVGDSGAGGVHGLVPAPAAGDTAAGKFLKASGAWAVPAGGGGGTAHYSKEFRIVNPPIGDSTWPFFKAAVAMTLVKIKSIIIGTGSGTMDVTIAGVEQLSPDQTLATTWTSSGTLAGAIVAADELTVKLKGIAGTVNYVVVQVDLTETL